MGLNSKKMGEVCFDRQKTYLSVIDLVNEVREEQNEDTSSCFNNESNRL